jgi:hypothetical protein
MYVTRDVGFAYRAHQQPARTPPCGKWQQGKADRVICPKRPAYGLKPSQPRSHPAAQPPSHPATQPPRLDGPSGR